MQPGDRVRVVNASPIIELSSDLGTILRADPCVGNMGYWIVRLDQPAHIRGGVSSGREIADLREHERNLDVVADQE